MAVRAGMTDLVSRLRSYCGAATNDLFQGVTYWTDDQLQNELDAVQVQAWNIQLTPIGRKIEGQTTYGEYAYQVPDGCWIEKTFTLRNADGAAQPAPSFTVQYVVDSAILLVRLTTPLNSPSTLVLEANVYDWHQAAAAVWGQKAAHRYDYVTVKAGDHRFAAEQELATCERMRDYHRGKKIRMFSRNRRGFVPSNTPRRY